MNSNELIQKYSLVNSKFMELFGVKVHYCDEGSGEVILLLHGVFSSLHTFNRWAEILSKSYRVIRLDLPGFGLTGPSVDNEYAFDLYVGYLSKFMDNLGVRDFHIAGNSFGGWIAWEYAVSNEDRVKKMILIDSAGYVTGRNYPLPFIIAQTPVLRNVFSYEIAPKFVVRRFLRQVIKDHAVVSDQLVNQYYDIIHRKGNLKAFLRIANSKFVQNTRALKSLKTSTLVLWGSEDAWISSSDAERFRNDLQHVSVKVYAGVGHIPMEEIPEESALDVLNFLKK